MIDLWPVQQAIYTALSATPKTFVAYDAVPQGATYPYFVIGEVSAAPDDELAADSADAAFQIHAWSRSAGKSQAYAMLAFARSRLNGQDIGAGVWACTEDFNEVFEDRASTAASRLYHGVARYRIRAN